MKVGTCFVQASRDLRVFTNELQDSCNNDMKALKKLEVEERKSAQLQAQAKCSRVDVT